MELLGTIEPASADWATGKAEWIRLIEAHPRLTKVAPKQGVNPFTKSPLEYRPSPDVALIVSSSSDVGMIHWAMDQSRHLVVWSTAGAEGEVRNVADDVATRLGWKFVAYFPAA